jgi:hypothetical protein
MSLWLTIISSLLGWVLYSSLLAFFFALMAWPVLRWAEHSGVVFNRVYLACLLWNLIGSALLVAVAAQQGLLQPPHAGLLQSGVLRGALVLDMLLGSVLLWRLIPRSDARRIRPASACMAVAMIAAIAYGAATSLP